jgi:hypothetical protein
MRFGYVPSVNRLLFLINVCSALDNIIFLAWSFWESTNNKVQISLRNSKGWFILQKVYIYTICMVSYIANINKNKKYWNLKWHLRDTWGTPAYKQPNSDSVLQSSIANYHESLITYITHLNLSHSLGYIQ